MGVRDDALPLGRLPRSGLRLLRICPERLCPGKVFPSVRSVDRLAGHVPANGYRASGPREEATRSV